MFIDHSPKREHQLLIRRVRQDAVRDQGLGAVHRRAQLVHVDEDHALVVPGGRFRFRHLLRLLRVRVQLREAHLNLFRRGIQLLQDPLLIGAGRAFQDLPLRQNDAGELVHVLQECRRKVLSHHILHGQRLDVDRL